MSLPCILVELTCPFCKKKFSIKRFEYNKRKKYRFITCSSQCRINYLNRIVRRDVNSPFKRLFYHARFSRKHKGNLTLNDVREQWQKQKGVCPYSGIKMILPETSKNRTMDNPRWASIDRIDTKKPYDKDNIQIVCVSINYAKNGFSDSCIRDFIQEIRSNPSDCCNKP